MQRFVASPAEYLQQVPPHQLPAIELLRRIIREAGPKLEERINYGMLCYGDAAGDAVALAAQKNTVCMYAMPEAVAMMAGDLAEVDHGKSCLRFTKLEKIPAATIKKLLKLGMSLRQHQSPPTTAAKKKTAKKKVVKKKVAKSNSRRKTIS
jgi:uncharacterized protein YdhG (YjbR/CyaY superfamily)